MWLFTRDYGTFGIKKHIKLFYVFLSLFKEILVLDKLYVLEKCKTKVENLFFFLGKIRERGKEKKQHFLLLLRFG
jgi:hypothetical protein